MKVHRIDHVGIIVNDLPAAKAFFLDLGLEMMGEGEVDKLCYIRGPEGIILELAEQLEK